MNDAYRELALRACLAAIDDYKKSRAMLSKKRQSEKSLFKAERSAERAERFILSPEFEWFSGLRGEDVLRALGRTGEKCGTCRHWKTRGRYVVCGNPASRRGSRRINMSWEACNRYDAG